MSLLGESSSSGDRIFHLELSTEPTVHQPPHIRFSALHGCGGEERSWPSHSLQAKHHSHLQLFVRGHWLVDEFWHPGPMIKSCPRKGPRQQTLVLPNLPSKTLGLRSEIFKPLINRNFFIQVY
ncbi:Ribosomal RNA processing Brix domain protein [Prunus dulcis]|uniref:Ribosomal RNA processing Brix domain protein n=1 Tax=Prunus dulcis TaxID=3755 RepID=A0A4Y1QPG3_PRUDU|nr:Ribosomal RNA processing Brix domain protein [Prunus dulcis]